jgi:metal-responsive CopG/Arc/MetJ family transcriptional regulator
MMNKNEEMTVVTARIPTWMAECIDEYCQSVPRMTRSQFIRKYLDIAIDMLMDSEELPESVWRIRAKAFEDTIEEEEEEW